MSSKRLVFKRIVEGKMKDKLLIFSIIVSLFTLLGCDAPPDYYTNRGLGVSVGELNNPGPQAVGYWTDETIDFWRLYNYSWIKCMTDVTSQVHAFFVDEDHVDKNGKQYSGLAHKRNLTIEISYGGIVKVRGVFIHELSHVYVGECGGVWSNDGSHAIFKEACLQALQIY